MTLQITEGDAVGRYLATEPSLRRHCPDWVPGTYTDGGAELIVLRQVRCTRCALLPSLRRQSMAAAVPIKVQMAHAPMAALLR